MWEIVRHPEAMKILRAEIDEALSPDDVIAPWHKVKNLPYLRACIDESMRLSPPVATDLLRKTPSKGTYTVDGTVVKGGTIVSISAYTAHRDPEFFPDPETFKPERWLVEEEKVKKMHECYLVFTMGTRTCLGKNVTIVQQLVYIATLLHRYEFALPHPDWEMPRGEKFNLCPIELPLKVWRREIPTPSQEKLSV